MFKVTLLIALTVAGASAQLLAPQVEAAPEPYSYGYETETHSAAEQRDPSGKVTGYYTLADADGRQRRVEYIADEGGFHAKVQTNEVGTKSENSADVEVLASPPNAEQLVYQQQAAPLRAATVAPRVQQQVVAAPIRSSVGYANQAYGAGYGYGSGYGYGANYPGYGYGSGYSSGYGSGYGAGYGLGYGSSYGYGANYPGYGYGYARNGAYGPAASTGAYTSYNNHLPSQYYRSIAGTAGAVAPAGYAAGNGASYYSRYSTGVAPTATYRSYQGVSGPIGAGYTQAPVAANGNLLGSSNYIVLKKK